jgi:hypothetical protein
MKLLGSIVLIIKIHPEAPLTVPFECAISSYNICEGKGKML